MMSVQLTFIVFATYKSIKYGKSLKFGRYISKFRDKLLRLQIPVRPIEPFCPITRHYIPEDKIRHLNVHEIKIRHLDVHEIKILSIFFLS